MTDEERRAHQEELRRARRARALLDAMGVDRSAINRTEMARAEALVDRTAGEVRRIERVGFAQGWAECVAFWGDWIWPGAPDPRVVDEGLGLPRG
jgi:hypothetical protein